jgi:3-oxoacyl-[acyl-carrier-protein] synthase-3
MNAAIRAVHYALPEKVLSTDQLAAEFPAWNVPKIDQQTGIHSRHIAAPEECASDLGVTAAEKLFSSGLCARESIDYLLFCTQTPDYLLPTTACLLQDRLGLPRSMGALDFNLGSSGYVYGLGLAQGLIASGQATSLLLITADTYSKIIHPADRSVRTLFGDAATVTWITAENTEKPQLGPFVYGTDGKGAPYLILRRGGFRHRHTSEPAPEVLDDSGNIHSDDHLYMNGLEIFSFTARVVPRLVKDTLAKAALTLEDIDLVIFHQANLTILEHLRKSLRIPPEKVSISLEQCGNTATSSIPIALSEALREGRVGEGSKVLLAGFGGGSSWAGTVLRVGAAHGSPIG